MGSRFNGRTHNCAYMNMMLGRSMPRTREMLCNPSPHPPPRPAAARRRRRRYQHTEEADGARRRPVARRRHPGPPAAPAAAPPPPPTPRWRGGAPPPTPWLDADIAGFRPPQRWPSRRAAATRRRADAGRPTTPAQPPIWRARHAQLASPARPCRSARQRRRRGWPRAAGHDGPGFRPPSAWVKLDLIGDGPFGHGPPAS